MTHLQRYSTALSILLLLAVGTGSLGCSSSLEGHMYVSEASDGPADYSIVVMKAPLGGQHTWALISYAEQGGEIASGPVEGNTLVGLPKVTELGNYWWAPHGIALDDGIPTFGPGNVGSMPSERIVF